MSTFTSTGTVKVRWSRANTKVFFAPDRDHYIQHDSRCYAVFVNDDDGSDNNPGAVVRALHLKCVSNSAKSVPLNGDNLDARMWAALAHAAAVQCKVKLKMKEANNGLEIDDVTVPAP